MIKKISISDLQQLRVYFNKNDKIKAIKHLKDLTGYNLKKTKKIIDNYFHNPASLNEFEYEVIEEETFEENTQTTTNDNFIVPTLNKQDLSIITQFLQKGQKINAVKIVKDKLDISLKDAKEYIDNFKFSEVKEKIKHERQDKFSDPIFKKQDEEIITFEKMNRREKKRRGTRSNSGCMLTLSIFIIVGIIITGGILYL